jgi:hypothetical protein
VNLRVPGAFDELVRASDQPRLRTSCSNSAQRNSSVDGGRAESVRGDTVRQQNSTMGSVVRHWPIGFVLSLIIIVGWASRTPSLIGEMLPSAGAHVRGVGMYSMRLFCSASPTGDVQSATTNVACRGHRPHRLRHRGKLTFGMLRLVWRPAATPYPLSAYAWIGVQPITR